MLDLSTRYMGLNLRTPLVVSANPLSQKVDNIAAMEDAGMLIVVVEANLKYKRPARFDDVLAVSLELYEVGAASMRIAYEIRRVGEEEPIATAMTRHALVSREGRVLRLTEEIRSLLARDEAVSRVGELG